jgi:hypothetical protein
MSTSNSTTPVEYRGISGVEGYRFGTDGTVWSTWTTGGRGGSPPNWPWLRLNPKKPSKRGYFRVWVKINGKATLTNVHTMILTAFRGPCPDGMECRHLDGNPLNNAIDNLAWGTPKENIADQYRHGTACVGERRNSAKFTPEIVREIRTRHAEGWGITRLARWYEVNHNAIGCIIRRKTWKHVL